MGDEQNPLGEENSSAEGDLSKHLVDSDHSSVPITEEEALLATATSEQPPFVSDCGVESQSNSGNPIGGGDEEVKQSEVGQFSSKEAEVNISNPLGPPLSEEDLLTGPAHNLDDSSYKADYVDPNLDDIFK